MIRVIILYAPDEKNIQDAVHIMKDAFEKTGSQVAATAAHASSITDISASEIIILGSDDPGKKSVHADYEEISRALQGINLAGRIAGIVSFGAEDKLPVFKKILNDSDITVFDKKLVIDNGKSPAGKTADAIAAWVNDIIKAYEGQRR